MNLADVLTTLRQWLSGVPVPAQVLTDIGCGFRVVFETENALAELIAGDGAYAPYRFVSFVVVDVRQDVTAEPVFCFYDEESHSIGDILRELDRGLAIITALK